MLVQKMLLQVSRLLAKVIFALVLTILTLLFLVHLPYIQREIAPLFSSYLSEKFQSRVEIERITFSIFGNVKIENLYVWDANANTVLVAREIEVKSNVFNLFRSDFIFDEIRIAGVDGHLIQREEGWNIQFIINAFKPSDASNSEATAINLQLKSMFLEDISVDYFSTENGFAFAADLGRFISESAEISFSPNKIQADKIYLESAVVNVRSSQRDTLKNMKTPKLSKIFAPDFGTGIVFEILDAELKRNSFSYHVGQEIKTTKFDPSHLELQEINGDLARIFIREDTLSAALEFLSLQLPAFKISDSKANIHLNRNQLNLSEVYFASGAKNELNAAITGWFNLPNRDNRSALNITAMARISPFDLSYFFEDDAVVSHFAHWNSLEAKLEATYNGDSGGVKKLNLKTANSNIQTVGVIYSDFRSKKIDWNDLTIQGHLGPDFERTIHSLLGDVKIPPNLNFYLKSTGNSKKFFVDGNVYSKWGNVHASGSALLLTNNIGVDVNLRGQKIDLGKVLGSDWLGRINFATDVKGFIGDGPHLKFKGSIDHVQILDHRIHKIAFQTSVINSRVTSLLSIGDPDFRSTITSEVLFDRPLTITTGLQLDEFNLSSLLRLDSTVSITGTLNSKIRIDEAFIEGIVTGNDVEFVNPSLNYFVDSIALDAMLSPKATRFNYLTDEAKLALNANFDIRDLGDLLPSWRANISGNNISIPSTAANRALSFNFHLDNAKVFRLLGFDIDEFSEVDVAGEFDEQNHKATLRASGERFKGFGVSADTISGTVFTVGDTTIVNMDAMNLFYNSINLGEVDFDLHTEGDTAITTLLVSNDSISHLSFESRILRSDSGLLIFPDKLLALENDFTIDRKNPVHVRPDNIVFDHFLIARNDGQVALDGDLNAFNLALTNIDLKPLNQMFASDSTIIKSGNLNGKISYVRNGQIDLQVDVDNLRVYNSTPSTITVKAVSDKTSVPFEFVLNNATGRLNINGQYLFDINEVNASILLDVMQLENFRFLVAEVVDNMEGAIKGKLKINGPIKNPDFNGSFSLVDVGFTTSNPKFRFKVADTSIAMKDRSLLLKDLILYDQENNPLAVNGYIVSPDYRSLNYDLQLHTKKYTLFNNSDSASNQLTGLLVIGSDLKITGRDNDTNVDAEIIIKDTSSVAFIVSNDEIELLKSDGIIDFVDPRLVSDSAFKRSGYFYDSLIASLPEFSLNSKVIIEDDAKLRIIMDAQSGDYIQASGNATLELGYDRTGNVRLSGNYTIKEGAYGVSFYDLVKKNFQLVAGSSITWSGRPENGHLDIKALYTLRSSSMGLIGNEIGENEKSIYKRPLPYNVGISIKGTIESPIVSFSLDVSPEERVNYPVLANKLDRLKQPEFQSELNRQVFGLLVLGGFLPETSGVDFNENLIATTALSNSVNSLLSSQLNRFARQYIKGVDIDVGLQSYSDYSASGGKTQTAIDFRVTKRFVDDRLSFEIGGDFNLSPDQSGTNAGDKNFRGDVAIIYDLTEQGNKKLKLFNNETYDIIYQEVRNTGISLIFIREFDKSRKSKDSGR